MRQVRLALVAAMTVLAGCHDPSGPGGGPPPRITALPRQLSPGELGIVTAGNRFGFDLLAQVNAVRAADNIFLSPLSASMALGMTMNGADGETYDEMHATLGFGSMDRTQVLQSYRDLIALLRGLDKRVDFRIANSIWYRDGFGPAIEPTFLSDARTYFDATASGLDFASPSAVATINDWVKTGTNGRIDKIVDRIGADIVMFLINAIYFKGDWREAFERSKTSSAAFRTEDGAQRQVPMMRRTGTMRAGVVDGRTVVDLGYGGDAFSMTVVLPGDNESVQALVRALSPAWWDRAVAGARDVEVDLSLPRFKLTWEDALNKSLQAMGMELAFRGREADFSRMSRSAGRDLYISEVRQKTFVDVNEEGTEAAAVTSVSIGVVSLPQRLVVRVDRPFVFAIRERLSGAIIFLGKIMEPPAS